MKKDMNLTLRDAADLKPHLRADVLGSPDLGLLKLGSPDLGLLKLGSPDLGLLKLGSPDLGPLKLGSPDMGLLKLASPDLERLIVQSNHGMMVSTTSPTTRFLYPKTVTEEQEFAEGFVKALEDLHKQNQLLDGLQEPLGPDTPTPGTLQPELPVYTNLSSYGLHSTDTVPFPGHQALSRVQSLHDEALQTVPDVQNFGGGGGGCGGDSSPLSPLSPLSPALSPGLSAAVPTDSQERVKAERKRLRNRIAASKCRKRKLERISRLEDKVRSLKSHNGDLASTAGVLRDQVARLKQRVLSHVSSGCQMLPQQVLVH
ncbi:hypothetical protein CRUP_034991 [Coryphaenoides rupestris]|nr:hypothetical protein CRUP_034991 [Coryphaenoides rupestris]